MLDHATIEEEQIAERYVMGKLPPDEATLFEEHYLSCPECLDRLELAESMERGFKRAAGKSPRCSRRRRTWRDSRNRRPTNPPRAT